MVLEHLQPIMAIDYDGTITKENDFPNNGVINDNCVEVVNILHNLGVRTILWTCRNGKELESALNHCKLNNIPLDYVNENVDDLFFPTSNKIFAHYIIDDVNVFGYRTWLEVFDEILKHPWLVNKYGKLDSKQLLDEYYADMEQVVNK